MREGPDERLHWATWSIFALAVLWSFALLQWGQALTWDELEFFRATRWVSEGRVPFRDFWEHHLPLQWILFAPVTAFLAKGPGAGAVLVARWAQVPLWVAAFGFVFALMRRADIGRAARWMAMLLLLSSVWFVHAAVQYRVDVPGHCAYLAAIWLLLVRKERWRAFAAGVLLAMAVLANMRLAPLVVITTLSWLVWRPDEERWGWNADGLRIAAGGLSVALVFLAALAGAHAVTPFRQAVIWYNSVSDALFPPEANSFGARLAAPFVERDVGGIVFLAAAAIGIVLALRHLRRPGILQWLSIMTIAALTTIAFQGVQYDYHFQTPLVLALPLAAFALWRIPRNVLPLFAMIAGASVLLAVMPRLPALGDELDYQNRVMIEIDRRTSLRDRVWDSVGYATTREPAYRYWFLPAGVRLLGEKGRIEPYDVEQMAADPPAAIIFNERTWWWLVTRPRLARYAFRHYAPLYQHLWIPAMNGVVAPGSPLAWRVPRTGRYDIYASELLLKHPWFSHPERYVFIAGPELAIALDRLPPVPSAALQWRVNGAVIPAQRVLDLTAGSQLELDSRLPRAAGVFVVPHGTTTLSIMPERRMVF